MKTKVNLVCRRAIDSGIAIAIIAIFQSLALADDKQSYFDGPMTIAASNFGDFDTKSSWFLSINSSGQAELTTTAGEVQDFEVNYDKLLEFKKELAKQSFFDLKDIYGSSAVVECYIETIAVTIGTKTKVVTMYSGGAGSKDEGIKRARIICGIVRGWIKNDKVVDMRPAAERNIDRPSP